MYSFVFLIWLSLLNTAICATFPIAGRDHAFILICEWYSMLHVCYASLSSLLSIVIYLCTSQLGASNSSASMKIL